MGTSKHLLLGTAAFLATIGGAQAADLPVKAKAIEYVRICSQYGAGFFYIPGTDTCIKLGGYLRADVTFNAAGAHGQPAWNGDAGEQNRYHNYFVDRSRMMLNIDTRTATDYGLVRTYGAAKFQFTTQGAGTVNPNSFSTSLPVAGTTGLLNQPGEGYVAVTDLFLQFAGFTFGKSSSAYANPWQGTPGNITAFLLGGHQQDNTGSNNIQYTASFGNGVIGTIGLDDPVVWDRTAVYNLSLPLNATLNTSNAYAGVHAPEIVGNIRVDQAWGLFQISAAGHEVSGAYNILNPTGTAAVPAGSLGPPGGAPNTLSEISGHPDTRWGGAVMASLNIKNLPTGTGDDIKSGCELRQGRDQVHHRDRCRLAELRHVRRLVARLSKRRLRRHHRRGLSADGVRRRRLAASHRVLGHARRLQPQLGCALGDQRVRHLFGRALRRHRQDVDLRELHHAGQGGQRGLCLQPRLQRLTARLQRALDAGQGSDIHGRNAVAASRPEIRGHRDPGGDGAKADDGVRVQGSGFDPAAAAGATEFLRAAPCGAARSRTLTLASARDST